MKEMTHEEMLEEAAKREEENETSFYRFFAVDYYATGEGISHWLKVCRNYGDLINGKDHDLEQFKEFLGNTHYYPDIEELNEEEFMSKYVNLIPSHIVKMVERKDQPFLDWETHFHVNYS